VYPGEGPSPQSISDELLVYEGHCVEEAAANGYGLDGMPLHPGQTGPTRRERPGSDTGPALLRAREEIRQLREALDAAEAQKKRAAQVPEGAVRSAG